MTDILAQIQAFIVAHYDLTQINLIVAYTIINTLVAVAAGIRTGTFDLSKVGEFLYKKLLPYVLVYMGVGAFGDVAGLTWLTPVSFAAIMTILTGDLTDSLYKLGIPMPSFLVKNETKATTALIQLTAVPVATEPKTEKE